MVPLIDREVPTMPFDVVERALWPETDCSEENSPVNELFFGYQTRVARVFAPGDVTGVVATSTDLPTRSIDLIYSASLKTLFDTTYCQY